jgi:hypothetical protein
VSGGADPDRAEGIFLGPPMSKMIVYTCPKTGREVPSGVLTDENSFAHLPHEKVTVQCLDCGDLHAFWTSEVRLAADATNEKPAR